MTFTKPKSNKIRGFFNDIIISALDFLGFKSAWAQKMKALKKDPFLEFKAGYGGPVEYYRRTNASNTKVEELDSKGSETDIDNNK